MLTHPIHILEFIEGGLAICEYGSTPPPKCVKARIRKRGWGDTKAVSPEFHRVHLPLESPLTGEDYRATSIIKRGTLEVINQDRDQICPDEGRGATLPHIPSVSLLGNIIFCFRVLMHKIPVPNCINEHHAWSTNEGLLHVR